MKHLALLCPLLVAPAAAMLYHAVQHGPYTLIGMLVIALARSSFACALVAYHSVISLMTQAYVFITCAAMDFAAGYIWPDPYHSCLLVASGAEFAVAVLLPTLHVSTAAPPADSAA